MASRKGIRLFECRVAYYSVEIPVENDLQGVLNLMRLYVLRDSDSHELGSQCSENLLTSKYLDLFS